MQAERDYLRQVVFPRVEEELRRGRIQLESIDLRQGVESADLPSEEAREQLVLKVCLEEIRRSRPFLIVLLGDRYGWVPPEERMAAAIQEVGFTAELRDKSVTALEIEFGILKQNPEQRQRSFFYFREPLPYSQMPEEIRSTYSDEFSPDAQTRARHVRLEALKETLRGDPELRPRVHGYRADWDASKQQIVGLEAWGTMVFSHLVQELQDELRAAASRPPQTWEEQEHVALAEFIEHRRRGFVGRRQLIDDLLAIAQSPSPPGAVFAIPAGVTWGACVTGEPGCGKSAIFAEMAARLSEDDSILLLTNAAGATPRGSRVEAMQERFIRELADVQGVPDPLPESATPDDVDSVFASLLGQVAGKRRVVVLLDALNQFDDTTRARHLTWLRARQWPANARLIATSLVAPAADALSQWAGIEELEVPPLTIAEDDTDDVSAIARTVWQRYHRQVNQAVLRVFKEKRLPDGMPAACNPLWLTLALEQINLLDSDDFARADRDFPGGPAERLRAMQVDAAQRMPPSVTELYEWLLAQTEKVFGIAPARAFAAVIAVSRFGWRESDLKKLIPAAARLLCPDEPEWNLDDLQLAALRRSFRAHVARCGPFEQLDFFHAQMRHAVRRRMLGDVGQTRSLHHVISGHLESLHDEDPLRSSELMVHLIAGDDPARAAKLYANLPVDSIALRSATQALTSHLVQGSDHTLAWVRDLLIQQSLTNGERVRLTERFNVDLHDALASSTGASARQALISATVSTLTELTTLEPDNCEWLYNLSLSRHRLGDLALLTGDILAARHHFEEMLRLLPRLARSSPHAARVGMIAIDKLGLIASHLGDVAEARRMSDSNLRATRGIAESLPDEIEPQRNYSFALNKAGDLAFQHEDFQEARRLYGESLRIRQKLAADQPHDAESQRECYVSIIRVGIVAMSQRDLAEAGRRFNEAIQIANSLAESDPANVRWQLDLSDAHGNLGKLAGMLNNPIAAERHFQAAISIEQTLASRFPENAELQRGLSISLSQLGELARERGDLDSAQALLGRSLQILEQLATGDPVNSTCQTDLATIHQKLAFLAWDRGSATDYETELRLCFQLLRRTVQRGQQLEPQFAQFFQQLCTMFDGES